MSRADDIKAALDTNEAWSPPEPTPFAELTTASLLPKAAYDAANDLAIDPAEADEIATVFFEHAGSKHGLGVAYTRGDEMGAAIGFAMFWGWLAAERAKRG